VARDGGAIGVTTLGCLCNVWLWEFLRSARSREWKGAVMNVFETSMNCVSYDDVLYCAYVACNIPSLFMDPHDLSMATGILAWQGD